MAPNVGKFDVIELDHRKLRVRFPDLIFETHPSHSSPHIYLQSITDEGEFILRGDQFL